MKVDHSTYRKAMWIAEQINEDTEDVYDVLIGVIRKPKEFVDAVFDGLAEYNNILKKNS